MAHEAFTTSSHVASPRLSHLSVHCGSTVPALRCDTGSSLPGQRQGSHLLPRLAQTFPAALLGGRLHLHHPSIVVAAFAGTPCPPAARNCHASARVVGRLQRTLPPASPSLQSTGRLYTAQSIYMTPIRCCEYAPVLPRKFGFAQQFHSTDFKPSVKGVCSYSLFLGVAASCSFIYLP